ncbi:OLC1v1038015C2 [Oldenlandia corymbosa var. corymbosa]|nr:OLC1v1038015C2 [Oldenlandia corymbosa var. corymbosa]
MFTLRIHSVDSPQRLPITVTYAAVAGGLKPSNSGSKDDISLSATEVRGIPHLFRLLPPSTPPCAATGISNPSLRSTHLFIVAVPNYMSVDDFILFCGNEVNHFQEIRFLRNDGVEDRYSVLIRAEDPLAAEGFYRSFNGKRFRRFEAEVCHIYFTQSVEYFDSAEIASTPPAGFTELPTCPICLERLDQDTSGIQVTLCDHYFHCSCVSKWTYQSCQVCRLCQQEDEKPTCAACGTLRNLWICLICGFVGCGRYQEGHAIRHWNDTKHHFSLELESQQIWDYVEDKYVHRLNQSKADGKSVSMNSPLVSSDVGCGTCHFEGDSGLNTALFSSKVEAIVAEYNDLLTNQLDTQRQNYEALLAEVRTSKEGNITRAVEKAMFSRMHELQSKLDSCEEEKNAVAQKNKDLIKKQELLQLEYKNAEAK